MRPREKYLVLQGKVHKQVLKNLFPRMDFQSPNTNWFFVDYSASQVLLGEQFDLIDVKGDQGQTYSTYTAKLIDVTDQFGRNLKEIPQGYKTISRFEFKPSIPSAINKIKTLKTWEYNPHSIRLFKKEIIKDIQTIPEKQFREAYLAIFLHYFSKYNQKSISEENIMSILPPSFNKEDFSWIIDFLTTKGVLKKKGTTFVLDESMAESR